MDGTLVIRLYTKDQRGVSKTIEWTGQVVRVYVYWPGSMDTLGHWIQWMETQWAEMQNYAHERDSYCGGIQSRAVRRSHLMGFHADKADGKRASRLYAEVTFTSLGDRRKFMNAMQTDLRWHRGAQDAGLLPHACYKDGPVVWHGQTCPVQQAFVRAGGAPGMWAKGQVEFLPDETTPPPTLRVIAFDIETCWA